MLALVASLLAIIAGSCLWTLLGSRGDHHLARLPGPPAWPLIGNLQTFGTSYLHKVLAEWAERYGSVYKWRLANMNILVVTDPQEVTRLCSKDASLPKANVFYKGLNTRAPHDNILAASDLEEWRYLRRMLDPAFTQDNVRKMYPRVYNTACQAVNVLQKLSKAGGVDISDLSQRIAADIMAAVAFEETSGNLNLVYRSDGPVSLVEREELKHVRVIQETIRLGFTDPLYALTLACCPWHPRTRAYKHSCRWHDKLNDERAKRIREKGCQPDSNTAVWACLSRLVNHRNGSPLPLQSLAAQVFIIFSMGFETVAHCLEWALFELAANTDLQAKVRSEVRALGAKGPIKPNQDPKPLSFEDLSKLPQLDCVIKETLRLHVATPMGSVREADDNTTVMGRRVPQGCPIMMPSWALHTSSANYEQPQRFWPERWAAQPMSDFDPARHRHPEATAKGNRRAVGASWNPFSSGPRDCIAQGLAMAELRTVLAVLLANFRFELPTGVHRNSFLAEEQVTWITLQAKHGVRLQVYPLDGHVHFDANTFRPTKPEFLKYASI